MAEYSGLGIAGFAMAIPALAGALGLFGNGTTRIGGGNVVVDEEITATRRAGGYMHTIAENAELKAKLYAKEQSDANYRQLNDKLELFYREYANNKCETDIAICKRMKGHLKLLDSDVCLDE